MIASRIRATAMVAIASAGLAGCSTYGGYGGASLGYGSGYYYNDYYPSSYYGWYDGYYYPGSGYFVYDRSGQRFDWNDNQRRHWQSRRHYRDERREWRQDRRDDRREWRRDRRDDRRDRRRGRRD